MQSAPEGPVLVTGATGFLGPHVVAEAVRAARAMATFAEPEGHPVDAVGRRLELVPDFCSPRGAADWHSVDLLEEGALERLVETCTPRHWIHCAALARIAECEADPALAEAMNRELPRRLGALCRAASVRLVHVSTDLVFGGGTMPKRGYREQDPVAPLSVYGRTKAEGEAALLETCPDALVVRLPLLYGTSGARGLGASDSLLDAIHGGAVPPLFVDEFRTPLEVQNAAAALVELACGDACGILHVAGPDRVDRHQLGLAILRAMGLDEKAARELVTEARRADAPLPETRPGDLCLDASRARELIETPLLGVEAGLERAMT